MQFSLYLDYNHSESINCEQNIGFSISVQRYQWSAPLLTNKAEKSDSLLPRAKQNRTLTQIHLLRDKDSYKYNGKIPTHTWLPP